MVPLNGGVEIYAYDANGSLVYIPSSASSGKKPPFEAAKRGTRFHRSDLPTLPQVKTSLGFEPRDFTIRFDSIRFVSSRFVSIRFESSRGRGCRGPPPGEEEEFIDVV